MIHSFSQPTTSQQIYPQNAVPYASQPHDSIPLLKPVHIQRAELHSSFNSENQWQKVGKDTETWMIRKFKTPKSKIAGLEGTISTTNRFRTLSDETLEESATQSTEPKPPPIFISGVTNIKSLIELLNAIAQDIYLVKTLYNDQVRVQPTESSVYTTIVKALMEKNTEFHTYKPRQDRSFRVVLKNIHPSTDLHDIKLGLKDKGHDVTNIWNVKQRVTN
jgi:hypothetical protein